MFPIPGLGIQFDSTIGLAEAELKSGRTGWVLAGGRSSRMGTDKALLDAGHGPLAVHVASLVTEVCGSVALVGDPVKYGGLGFSVIPDRTPGQGPLAGIDAALSASETEWNLIVACDMPSLEASVFEALFAAAEGFDCAVPQHPDGKIEPLCAVYNRRCQPLLEAALRDGVRSVKDGLQLLAVRYLQMGNSGAFANLNTPEEMRKYRNG